MGTRRRNAPKIAYPSNLRTTTWNELCMQDEGLLMCIQLISTSISFKKNQIIDSRFVDISLIFQYKTGVYFQIVFKQGYGCRHKNVYTLKKWRCEYWLYPQSSCLNTKEYVICPIHIFSDRMDATRIETKFHKQRGWHVERGVLSAVQSKACTDS